MSKPCLSVVITTYNRGDLLSRAVESVLRQSMADFELIIVDDCSTDGTEALVRTLTDPRLRYLRHARNSGVSAARNTGIRAAVAETICFLDDDDEYLPLFLQHIRDTIRQYPNTGFIWTGVHRVFAEGKKVKTKVWNASRTQGHVTHDKAMLFLTEFSACCGLTVSKACFEKAGLYREDMTISEDLELVFRLVSSGCDYHAIALPLIQVNIHPRTSLSRNASLQKHIQNTKYLIDANAPLLSAFPKVFLHYHTVLLAHYYRAAAFDKARALAKIILRKNLFYFPAWERILRFEFKRIKKSFSR